MTRVTLRRDVLLTFSWTFNLKHLLLRAFPTFESISPWKSFGKVWKSSGRVGDHPPTGTLYFGVATPEISGVATPEISGVATQEVSGVATPEIFGVATPDLWCYNTVSSS